MTTVALPKPLRVAVYTRKSVTHGLDQAFNSLDSQRHAIESYVQSQAGLGWTTLDTRYDDGGFSGSTIDRPGFQALLRDIEAGHVDVVAVYKIDRLSRSLSDFAKLIDLFEQHDVTFVSVTQQFTTANSMGRLTLNILMSFAEFEREVIGERIRDKVRASRRRGAWTGGRPVLGYDVVDKKLVVNEDEAEQVRQTFELYLDRTSLREVVDELNHRAWRNKSFVSQRGQQVIGKPFTKTRLHGLLTNVLYCGQIRCQDEVVDGQHERIVPDSLWDAVQEQLSSNGHKGGSESRNKTGALLRGLVRCGRCDSAMVHTFTTRDQRRHRYYVCSLAHNSGVETCPGSRVAAGRFEQFVADQMRVIGTDEVVLAKTIAAATKLRAERQKHIATEQRRLNRQLRYEHSDEDRELFEARLRSINAEATALDGSPLDGDTLRTALASFEPVWDELFPAEQERILRLLIERITYHPDDGDVDIELRPCGIEALADEAKD